MIVHLLGWLPLALLIMDFFAHRLTANPIQAVEQRLGRTAVYFLIASLSVTPVSTITGWQEILPRRRALGLYAFFYASLHFLTFAGLDYGFDLRQVLDLIATKPYILIGTLAFTLLLPLAVTSFDYFIRRMKKNWKRLHWLVYPAAPVVILHFALARKGSLLQLQGNILQPLGFGLLLIMLFLLRLSPVRKTVTSWRHKILEKRIPQKHENHS